MPLDKLIAIGLPIALGEEPVVDRANSRIYVRSQRREMRSPRLLLVS